jgi:hypothetical protein
VDHEVDVVHQDPFAFRVSLDMEGAVSQFAESFVDAFPNRLIVAARGSGTDDEVIRERANVGQIDNDNILRLLVEGGFKSFGQ